MRPVSFPILHIAREAEWRQALERGEYRPDGFDRDGFIHCSTPVQLPEVASRVFPGQRGLVLLTIETDRLTSDVRFENVDGGAILYPHVYGGLNLGAVSAAQTFEPAADGRFGLPLSHWQHIKACHPQAQTSPRPVFLRGSHFDGASHWAHRATLVRAADGMLELSTPLGQSVATDRGEWLSPYHTTSYLWPDRYYNAIRLTNADGSLDGWYCNIASPVIFDGEAVNYVDLQLDVRVLLEDGGSRCEVWDEDEFTEARQRYGYDESLVRHCYEAVEEIKALVAGRVFPFST